MSVLPAKPNHSLQRLLVTVALCMLPPLFSAETSAPVTQPPPPPGRLIDLGGYSMHLLCTGQGSPTVVLSAGSGDFSFDWALVQPEVAKLSRVCSYDRAGEAWSDLGPAPRTMTQEVFDLHRALAKAGVPGPYILVGHSSGGAVMRLFAALYPTEVIGMVLVDGSHEEDTGNINGKETTMLALSKGRPIPAPRTNTTPADGLNEEAVKKIQEMVRKYDFMQPHIESPYDKLPAAVQRLQLWATGQPKHWAATSNDYGAEEAERLYKTDHATEHPLGSIPLIVLSQDMTKRTDEHAKIHMRTQATMAGYSTRGRQIIVPGAGHHIQLEQPAVVVDAIRQVLVAARTSLDKDDSHK